MTTTQVPQAPEWKAAPPRKNIWEEAFRIFKQNFNEWLPSALIFAVATAAVGIFLLQGTMEVISIAHGKEKMHLPKGYGVAALVFLALVWIQSFYYLIFYAKKELPYGKAEMTVGRFFYVEALQIIVILLCALVAKFGSTIGSVVGGIVGALFSLISYGFYYFLMVRLLLVYPLSGNAIRPVFETSWALSKGNWWRLFGNYLIIGIFLFLGAIPLGIVAAAFIFARKHAPGLEMPGMIGLAVLASGYFVINVGVISAFLVAAARILIDEKRQSDPSFLSPKQA